MGMRIGFMASLGYAAMEPREVCASLVDLGYESVEWTLAHCNPRDVSGNQVQRIATVTAEHGLALSEVVVQQDFVTFDESARRDRIELVKECIKAAGEVGVKVLNVFSGPASWDSKAPVLSRDIQEGQAWDMVLGAYDELVPLAEKSDVYLAVEAVFNMLCRDYYTTRVLIDHFDSPHLGVNMDPSHYVLYRNDAPWVVKQWGDKIMHVHLKDVVGVPGMPGDSFLFPLLGEGMVDWKVVKTRRTVRASTSLGSAAASGGSATSLGLGTEAAAGRTGSTSVAAPLSAARAAARLMKLSRI